MTSYAQRLGDLRLILDYRKIQSSQKICIKKTISGGRRLKPAKEVEVQLIKMRVFACTSALLNFFHKFVEMLS
jgi:hypothetical protein